MAGLVNFLEREQSWVSNKNFRYHAQNTQIFCDFTSPGLADAFFASLSSTILQL